MLLDFQELFEPYSKDGCTIELFIKWLLGEGIDRDVASHVLAKTFLEIKNGRSFLQDCDCGCESPNIHTYLNHYVLRQCRKFHQSLEESKRVALQEDLNDQILAHIHEQNEQFINETFPGGTPPVVEEIEAKWKQVLIAQDKELQKREKVLMIKEAMLRNKTSAFYREQEEARLQNQAPRWKFWKRRK